MNPWAAAPIAGSVTLLASLTWSAVSGVKAARRIRARISAIGAHPTSKAIWQLEQTRATLSSVTERLAAAKSNLEALENDVATLAAAYARARVLVAEVRAMIDAVRASVNL